jgi:hypothetical protein
MTTLAVTTADGRGNRRCDGTDYQRDHTESSELRDGPPCQLRFFDMHNAGRLATRDIHLVAFVTNGFAHN